MRGEHRKMSGEGISADSWRTNYFFPCVSPTFYHWYFPPLAARCSTRTLILSDLGLNSAEVWVGQIRVWVGYIRVQTKPKPDPSRENEAEARIRWLNEEDATTRVAKDKSRTRMEQRWWRIRWFRCGEVAGKRGRLMTWQKFYGEENDTRITLSTVSLPNQKLGWGSQ